MLPHRRPRNVTGWQIFTRESPQDESQPPPAHLYLLLAVAGYPSTRNTHPVLVYPLGERERERGDWRDSVAASSSLALLFDALSPPGPVIVDWQPLWSVDRTRGVEEFCPRKRTRGATHPDYRVLILLLAQPTRTCEVEEE